MVGFNLAAAVTVVGMSSNLHSIMVGFNRRYSDMTQYAFIGWRPADNSLNFYAKFSEEGVDEHAAKRNNGRPVPYIRAIHLFERAKLPAEAEITRIGVALYEKKLKEVLGE